MSTADKATPAQRATVCEEADVDQAPEIFSGDGTGDSLGLVDKPDYTALSHGGSRGSIPSLGTMLRIHLMQQWFGSSDPAMQGALHDVPMLREFAGLDAEEDAMPDEPTILKFRQLLETHQLA